MFLRELFEGKARKIVAVMPGGFHPFHPGHKSLYDWAVKTFGQSNVYVAATNDTKARPFPFEVKKKLAAMAGVPESNFMQVKSPFNNREYADLLDADTALVFVRSQKDKSEQPLPDQTKKNGEPGYLRSYTGKDLNTADEMGYMAYGPTINFDFSGMQIKSASELRATWPEMSDEDKLKAAKLMYGNGAPVAVKLLDKALGDTEEPVKEQQLNELAWFIPALIAGARIAGPAVVRALGSQASKKAAAEIAKKGIDKSTKDIIAKGAGQVAKGAGKVAKGTGKQMLKRPGTTAAVGGGVYAGKKISDFVDEVFDSIDQAKEFLTNFFGEVLDSALISQLAKIMVRYAIPVALIVALLYGGYKILSMLDKKEPVGEDASPEEEDAFHVELDKLVHKYFGHSSDEKKEKEVDEILGFATRSPKRATRTVKRRPPEDDSVQDKIKKRRALASKVGVKKAFSSDLKTNESDVVLDKTSVRSYIRDMIIDYLDKENDIEKLSKILKMLVGKEVKARGSRYQVTSEDIVEACKSMRKKRRG